MLGEALLRYSSVATKHQNCPLRIFGFSPEYAPLQNPGDASVPHGASIVLPGTQILVPYVTVKDDHPFFSKEC